MRYSNEHIDEFIAGRLTPEDAANFKRAVNSSEDLLLRLTERTVRLYGQQKLRSKLRAIDGDSKNDSPNRDQGI